MAQDDQTREPEAPTGPEAQPGYSERSSGAATTPTGDGAADEQRFEKEGPPQGGEHLGEAPLGGADAMTEGQAPSGTGDNPEVGGITTGPGSHGDTPEGARFGHDSGGKAHTAPGEGEGHPAGTGERSDRDVGGPTSAEGPGEGGEPGTEPGAHGDIQTKGFDAHE